MTRAMRDPNVRARRFAARYDEPASSLNRFVDQLRSARGVADVPYVDPTCGGAKARLLTLLMDPGPMAHGRNEASGMLSWDNDDPTAAEMARQLAGVGISWDLAVPWNASPWPGSAQPAAAQDALVHFLGLLPDLEVCMPMGGKAQAAWDRLLRDEPGFTRIHRIDAPHPSIRGLTRGGRQTADVGKAVLRDAFAKAALVLAVDAAVSER